MRRYSPALPSSGFVSLKGRPGFFSSLPALKRPAYREPERAKRLKIVQATGILQCRLDLQQNRRIALVRMQRVRQPQRLARSRQILQIDLIEWRDERSVDAQ